MKITPKKKYSAFLIIWALLFQNGLASFVVPSPSSILSQLKPFGHISQTRLASPLVSKTVVLLKGNPENVQTALSSVAPTETLLEVPFGKEVKREQPPLFSEPRYKNKTDQLVSWMEEQVARLKHLYCSRDLVEFDQKRKQFWKHQKGLADYVTYLDAWVPVQSQNLKKIVAVAWLEENLDEQKMRTELDELSKTLLANLSRGEKKQLQSLNQSYLTHQISESHYLELVKALSHRAGICFSGYLETNLYSRLAALREELDVDFLPVELTVLEEKVKNKLVQSERQHEIIELSEDVDLLKKLGVPQLSERDWHLYVYKQEGIKEMANRFRRLGVVFSPELKPVRSHWKVYEEFYSHKMARSEVGIGLAATQIAHSEAPITLFVLKSLPLKDLFRELEKYAIHIVVVSPPTESPHLAHESLAGIQIDPISTDQLLLPLL